MHLVVTAQSVIQDLWGGSSALQEEHIDGCDQKHEDSEPQGASLLALPAGGFSLGAAGGTRAARASERTGSEVVRYWACKHDTGEQRPF